VVTIFATSLVPPSDELIDFNSTKVLMGLLEIVIVSDTHNNSTNNTNNTVNHSSLAVTAVIGIAISICVVVIVAVIMVTLVICCFYKQKKYRYCIYEILGSRKGWGAVWTDILILYFMLTN